MERRLSDFFTEETSAAAGLIERSGSVDPVISSLTYDSREVQPGSLYFALPGVHTDGHKFIADAIERGAVAVVYEGEDNKQQLRAVRKDSIPPWLNPGVTYLKVKNSRFAMSPIAAAFYGFPSSRLLVAGVTGSEGKSTTVFLIWQLLRLMGKKAGFFSTVEHSDGGEAQWKPKHHTTPEALSVQRMLWEMAENGCAYAVVEASSHGLSSKNNRLGDVEFEAAVFTTVNHEHMEFHGTWEQYRSDKANLFRALDKERAKKEINGMAAGAVVPEPFGVINADDKSAEYFAGVTKRKTVDFSTRGNNADLMVKAIESGAGGNWYDVCIAAENANINIRDRLPGAFNGGNLLAALLTVSGLTGVPVSEIAPFCPRLQPVKGRMTAIDKGQPFEVLVDYAHSPGSFTAIYPPLRERATRSGGRIISLFGSPGERDTQKRAEQGKIAAEYSDFIVLTDDDPRSEPPMDIIEQIAAGVYSEGASFKKDENLFLIPDRPAAIRKALSLAKAGDIVLLLGRGHENTIFYADHEKYFDEIADTGKMLDEMGKE
jgi:UDP-N-acetylmuramoyl-L-alanyl-D-glutamate--2,6-diaminopimelate ligase